MRRRSALLITSIAGSIAASIAFLIPGCAGRDASLSAELGDLALRRAIEELWRAHGGLEAWASRQRARVRFSVSGDSHVPGFLPAVIEFALRDWTLIDVGEGAAREVIFLEDEPGAAREERAMDYQIRTARMLFQLPFALSLPGWELRRDLIPGHGDPRAFWAVPAAIPSPNSDYYLIPDPATGLLGSVYFQATHPGYEGKVFVAEYRRYRRVDGMVVPTEIVQGLVHDPAGPAGRDLRPVDPFEPERAMFDPARLDPAAGPPVVFPLHWVLRFEEISFE